MQDLRKPGRSLFAEKLGQRGLKWPRGGFRWGMHGERFQSYAQACVYSTPPSDTRCRQASTVLRVPRVPGESHSEVSKTGVKIQLGEKYWCAAHASGTSPRSLDRDGGIWGHRWQETPRRFTPDPWGLSMPVMRVSGVSWEFVTGDLRFRKR